MSHAAGQMNALGGSGLLQSNLWQQHGATCSGEIQLQRRPTGTIPPVLGFIDTALSFNDFLKAICVIWSNKEQNIMFIQYFLKYIYLITVIHSSEMVLFLDLLNCPDVFI